MLGMTRGPQQMAMPTAPSALAVALKLEILQEQDFQSNMCVVCCVHVSCSLKI